MKRVLGIDYGEKRVGLALSDPFGWTAQPLLTLTYTSVKRLFHEVLAVIRDREVEGIVLGLPLSMNGGEGIQVEKVRKFAQDFQAFLAREAPELSMPIEFMDERLTTSIAERILIDADMSRKRRKEVIDKQAAAVLLQTYLDMKASQG